MARNGRLPASQLASIPGTNERIHVNLIDQTNALRAAFRKRFGKTLSITDAYRPYGTQVYLRNLYLAGRGNYAVPPGTSNHGWATAIDFGSGVNVYNSTEHKWMVANAPRFGYTWLTRAGNGSIEPWHFDAKVVPVSNYASYLASNNITVPNLELPDGLEKRMATLDEEDKEWLRTLARGEMTQATLARAVWTFETENSNGNAWYHQRTADLAVLGYKGEGETRDVYSYIRQTYRKIAEQDAIIDNLVKAVAALGGGAELDTERLLAEIRKAAEDGTRAAIGDSLEFDVEISPRAE